MAEYWDGDIPWVTPEDLGRNESKWISTTARAITEEGYRSCGTTLAPTGSLALSCRAPIGHLAIAEVPMCCNQGCKLLVPHQTIDSHFVYYTLTYLRGEIQSRGAGSTFSEISRSALGEVRIPDQDIGTQRVIADFLDGETEKIDALVAKKRRLIELLGEQWTATINRAVTTGLDHNVAMRTSGIDWLGSIPAGWSVRRLKRISPSQSVGLVINPSTYVVDDGVPFLFGSDISEFQISIASARRITEESNRLLSASMIRAGDLVTVRVGDPGVTAVVPPDLDRSNCASVMITRGSPEFDSGWLCYAMNSRIGRAQVEMVQYGAAQKQFNISHAVNFVYPVPPRPAQVAIRRYLDVETSKIEALRLKVQGAIGRLKEYRSALVTAAVTGQVNVREHAQEAS
jgi:type I restriction enzyme S subunit